MKKGFTLVEIIISVALVVVIGFVATFGILTVNKKKNLEKLDDMSSKIYEAVHVLIETNDEIKDELYASKNAVSVPLKKLESEGLIDFEGVNIEDQMN